MPEAARGRADKVKFQRTKVFEKFVRYDHVPTTSKQQVRIVRRGAFAGIAPKPEVAAAVRLHQALWHSCRPRRPYDGPIQAVVEFYFPFRATERKSDLERGWMFHIEKPDSDNLAKLFLDALAPEYFRNDSIVYPTVFKYRSAVPGVRLAIYRLSYPHEPAKNERQDGKDVKTR